MKKSLALLTSFIIVSTMMPTIVMREVLCASATNSFSGLVINEVCASNTSCLQAENGTYPDWIELYNASDTAIDVSGVGVSNGAKKKFKFKFDTNTELAPGEYCIILCDKTNVTQGELHADFNIGAAGETLYLTAPDETNIDTVEVPALDTDVTYGRFPDGASAFAQITPTPGASNNDATVIVAQPEFSVSGGFFGYEFNLTLSDSNNNTILYTMDGSDPRTSETAVEYTSDIHIYDNTNDPNVVSAYEDITLRKYSAPNYEVDKGIVVRAVCKNSVGAYSGVVTNNYFVDKTASYYSEMRVIAISTDINNLYDGETGIYTVGNQYYRWVESEDYDQNLNKNSHLIPTNYNMEGREWERPCNIQVFENGQLQFTQDVGMRISGNWTTYFPQKSLTLYARSDYGQKKMKYDFFEGGAVNSKGKVIKEYKKVTLRNNGNDNGVCYCRDDLNQLLSNGLSFGTQAKAPYIVFIDGEFWGYYSMQEKEDENYIESHYDIDSDYVTIIENGTLDEGSEEVFSDWQKFWNWAMTSDLTIDENYQYLCDIVDIYGFIDWMAVECYINNSDCLITPNNWRIWRANQIDSENPFADGKWRFLLYDTDLSCGFNDDSAYNVDSFQEMDSSKRISSISSLYKKLMLNSEFKWAFYERFYEIANSNFEPQYVQSKIEEIKTNLNDVVNATKSRFGIKGNYKKNMNDLSYFFNNRQSFALNQLDAFCGIYSLVLPNCMKIVDDDIEHRFGDKYYDGAVIKVSVKDGFAASNVKANGNVINADKKNNVYTIIFDNKDMIITADEEINIIKQPADYYGTKGSMAMFSIADNGNKLFYRWQYSKDGGKNWKSWDTDVRPTAATADFEMSVSDKYNGWLMRCEISSFDGKVVYSKPASLILTSFNVTAQPKNVYGKLGENVCFEVETDCNEDVSYQWQYSKDGGNTWKNWGFNVRPTAATKSFEINAAEKYCGWLMRCQISTTNGEKVYSDSAKLNLSTINIAKQPYDEYVCANGAAQFYIDVDCTQDVEYQWQYSKDNGVTWKNWDIDIRSTAATHSFEMSAAMKYNGWLMRCRISNVDGETIYSDYAKLNITGISIITQPKNQCCKAQSKARFSIQVDNSDLSYQWQYSKDNGKTWKSWDVSVRPTAATSTFEMSASEKYNGWLMRCQISNSGGETVYSEPAMLTVSKLDIISQSQDVSVNSNEKAVFTVGVNSTSDVTYQWQYSKNHGETWISWDIGVRPSAATATFEMSSADKYNGWLMRCWIVNSDGLECYSNHMMLNIFTL